MTADEVLDRLARTYAGLTTYRDAGRVVTRYFPDGRRPHSEVKTFTTAFARPDRFRFEFRSRAGDADDEWDPAPRPGDPGANPSGDPCGHRP